MGIPEVSLGGCHEGWLEIWLDPRAPRLMDLDGGEVMPLAIKADRVV